MAIKSVLPIGRREEEKKSKVGFLLKLKMSLVEVAFGDQLVDAAVFSGLRGGRASAAAVASRNRKNKQSHNRKHVKRCVVYDETYRAYSL